MPRIPLSPKVAMWRVQRSVVLVVTVPMIIAMCVVMEGVMTLRVQTKQKARCVSIVLVRHCEAGS